MIRFPSTSYLIILELFEDKSIKQINLSARYIISMLLNLKLLTHKPNYKKYTNINFPSSNQPP